MRFDNRHIGHYIKTRIGYKDAQVKYNLSLYYIEKEDKGDELSRLL
jgi:hypothetical protein